MIQITKVLTLMVFGSLFLNLSAQESQFKDDPIVKEKWYPYMRTGLDNIHIIWSFPWYFLFVFKLVTMLLHFFASVSLICIIAMNQSVHDLDFVRKKIITFLV